jgi:ankyrin repeat protein
MDELMGRVLGDPRWNGVTALHGSVVSGQAGIVKFLLDRGADPHATNAVGWTPLMLAEGVFFANAKKEYPAAAALLRAAAAPPAAR